MPRSAISSIDPIHLFKIAKNRFLHILLSHPYILQFIGYILTEQIKLKSVLDAMNDAITLQVFISADNIYVAPVSEGRANNYD